MLLVKAVKALLLLSPIIISNTLAGMELWGHMSTRKPAQRGSEQRQRLCGAQRGGHL